MVKMLTRTLSLLVGDDEFLKASVECFGNHGCRFKVKFCIKLLKQEL